MRLATVIKELGQEELVEEIEKHVKTTEMTSITRLYKGEKLLLFKDVDHVDVPVATNVVGSRSLIRKFFNTDNDEEVYKRLLEACNRPMRCNEEVKFNDSSFSVEVGADLSKIPMIKYYRDDPGYYITSGIVIAKGPKSGIYNASIHRMLILDRQRMAIRIVPRHLWQLYREATKEGRSLPVAIVIGAHPLVLIASSSSPPFGVNEIEVANALLDGKLEVTRTPNYKLIVPAQGEILIEGEITQEMADEGPFVDLTGTYDIKRKQPVIHVRNIWISDEPIYHAIVPASREHMLLMGLYREALIWDYVRRVVPRVIKVRLTEGGGGWLSAAIAISKSTQGDGKNAILAAFAAHPSLKQVVVVDEDIDIDDPYQIEWAIATRVQASRDIVIIKNVRGSSLDPSADQRLLVTDKMGIDATMDITKPKEKFIKVPLEINKNVKRILSELGSD